MEGGEGVGTSGWSYIALPSINNVIRNAFDVFMEEYCEIFQNSFFPNMKSEKGHCKMTLRNFRTSFCSSGSTLRLRTNVLTVWMKVNFSLTLPGWRSLSSRNQSIDLFCKSVDGFIYDRDLRHERVNGLIGLVIH